MTVRLLSTSVRHPWFVLTITLIVVVFLSFGIPGLGFKNDYRVYFGSENPQLLAFEKLQSTFSKSDNLLFIVEPKGGQVFKADVLKAIQILTNKAWQLPYSSRVDSLTNFQHTVAEADDLLVSDLVLDPNQLTDNDIQRIKQIALAEPLLLNRLVSKTGHVAGVNVTVQLPQKNLKEVDELVKLARLLVQKITHDFPEIKIHLTGIVMMNNAFSEVAMDDNLTLMPIMYVIVIVILWLCLRSVSATLSTVLIIIVAITAALGSFGWFNWLLNPTSAIAPLIILTVAVADCIHLLQTQLHLMRMGFVKKQAIIESLRINFTAISLTSLTTAIGFLSMNFSDAPPFRDLGNLVALGVVFAWLLSLTLLPAMMAVLPVRVSVKEDVEISNMIRFAGFVIRRKKSLLIFNFILVVIFTSFAPLNELNDEFVKYFDTSIEFRRASDFLNENLGGMDTLEISLNTGTEGGVYDPDFLNKVNDFVLWSELQPEVKHVNSITHVLTRLNKNLNGDDSAYYKLPDQKEFVAQYLLMYEMSLPYGLDLNDQLTIDKSGTKVTVTFESLSSNELLDVERRFAEWFKSSMPEVKTEMASTALMFAHIGKRNIGSMILGTLMALVLISLILILAFRSVRLGLISLIPNLAPACVGFGVWYLIDGRVGLALSVVTSITMGIVVDDTIHFISKYRLARLERQLSREEGVKYAFSTVGVAMWMTTLVLVCGFGVLSFSHFTVNYGLGLLTAITISIALFMDLLFLPPLLMLLDKKHLF